MDAYGEFLVPLRHGQGKFSEDDAEHTTTCLKTLFLDMGEVFSYQSELIHPDDEEDDDDDEEEIAVPDHVANRQYDLY